MLEDGEDDERKYRDAERIRRSWDKHARTFDEWDDTFSGAIQQYVDRELLKRHLPQDRNSKILLSNSAFPMFLAICIA
jgi:hypothetical protein